MSEQERTDVEDGVYAEADSADDEANRIEADIAATRDEMTGTVEAIGDRLAPSNIVKEATSTVREATVGKVEDMTSTASDALSGAGSTVQETGAGVLETIKQNPIPAALAGLGIAWMWTHRANSSSNMSASRGRTPYWPEASGYGARSRYQDTGYAGSDAWSEQGTQQDGIGDKVGEVTDELGRRASQMGDAAGRMPSQLGGGAQGLARQAQDLMEQSPLAAGAVALAVGAAISMVLPVTQTERRVLGPTAGQVLGKVEDTATDALQKARETTPA